MKETNRYDVYVALVWAGAFTLFLAFTAQHFDHTELTTIGGGSAVAIVGQALLRKFMG